MPLLSVPKLSEHGVKSSFTAQELLYRSIFIYVRKYIVTPWVYFVKAISE